MLVVENSSKGSRCFYDNCKVRKPISAMHFSGGEWISIRKATCELKHPDCSRYWPTSLFLFPKGDKSC